MIAQIERADKEGTSIYKLPKATQDFYYKVYKKSVTEKVNLKAAHLSSEDYQKAKKLKAFNSADWTWNSKSGLYDRVNESTVTEGEFKGSIAGDVADGIAKELSQYVKGVIEQPNDSVTYLHAKDKSAIPKIIQALTDLYGVSSQDGRNMFSPSKTVKFDSDQMVTESVVTEAFSRMSSDTIENELYNANKQLSDYYDWLKAGNDSGKGNTLDSIIDLLKKCKSNIKRFNKPEEVKDTVYESIVTEGNQPRKEIEKAIRGMKGVSMDIKGDTIIVSNKAGDEFKYSMNDADDVADFITTIEESVEPELTEKRNIQTKRKYTENHPAKTVGKAAKIRNKILEAIKDGKMNQSSFDKLVKELSSDNKRWMKRNDKLFNVSEDGVSLSMFGQKILKGITVNEINLVNESFKSFTDSLNE
jgi:hypothetical protein